MPRLLTDRFGLSFTRAECYCGSTLNASGSVGTSAADSVCQAVACPGDASLACGGPWRMRLYKSSPVTAPSSSSAPAPIASGTGTALPSGWQSKGCASFSGSHGHLTMLHSAPRPVPDGHYCFPLLLRRQRWLGPATYRAGTKPRLRQHASRLHRSLRYEGLHLRRRPVWHWYVSSVYLATRRGPRADWPTD
jgi:hypothetical protein